MHACIYIKYSPFCFFLFSGCLGHAADLVFALDASVGVGRENFATLQDFVRSISVQFDVNRDVAQIALVAYNRRATTVFGLDAHESGSAILKAVGEASYMGGGVSTGAALLHIYSKVLTVANGARPGVNKAVVVVTDGSGGDDAVVPAQKIRDSGVSVFLVGIGDMQRDKLLMIAGSEEYMISVPSYEDLKYFEDVLVQMVCSGKNTENHLFTLSCENRYDIITFIDFCMIKSCFYKLRASCSSLVPPP